MPNPILERAARAVHDCGLLLDTDECEQAARAVLRAIREPSEGMVAMGGYTDLVNAREPTTEAAKEDVRNLWRYMIDAALGEE